MKLYLLSILVLLLVIISIRGITNPIPMRSTKDTKIKQQKICK